MTKFKVIPNANGAYSISPEGQVLSNAHLIKRPITASGNYYTKDRKWCTASENIQYSAKRGRYSNMSAAKIASSTAPRPYLYRAVDQYDANGIYIQTFASITAASQYLRQEGKIQNAVSGKTNIVAVCKGTAHTCGGYKWKYHADK